jgi:hypothetical protein
MARYRRSMVNERRQIKIGDWFPADDPVAVFVTTVAMISNDLLRLVDWMLRSDWTDDESAGDRLFAFRVEAAAFCEASRYLRETPPRWPEIQDFVRSLGPKAAAELLRVQAAGDPGATDYMGKWLTDHRNLTFHYAAMAPERVRHGLHAVARALAQTAPVDAPLGIGDRIGEVRYTFADTIAVQWLPDEPEQQIDALRDRITDIAWFAQRAVTSYISPRLASI